ncbi:hypothetical protein AVEN_9432-1 [Araneus ventricosus]|uniref:Uncharacterized protein n=1 Tax=Araneus ventricosus TaxID=182803 RepID=A0A4Y2FQQ9_ARAVE|nr:hypothetical protein AVEN_9432-1 [Araneus ventricosus]
MVIGSLDRKVTFQKTKSAKQKLMQVRYKERNKTLIGVSSSSMDLNNECRLKGHMCENLDLSAPSAIVESGAQNADDVTVTPVVTKFSAVSRTLDRFGISDRAGAATYQLRFKIWALSRKAMFRTLLIEIKFGLREQRQEPFYRLSQL